MNSFDVFDTLLARRYVTSDSIWQFLEQHFGIPNFAAARISADTGARTFAQIYIELVDRGVVPKERVEQIAQKEIELEYIHAIPVRRNLDRVSHGDLLISDTYLPPAVILEMTRRVGLDKQVTIYQSNSDKSSGAVWGKLKHKPALHLGDNQNSDYVQPTRAGIKAEWFHPATELNEIEKALQARPLLQIALLAREIRLGFNPPKENAELFDLACDFNLPMLFFFAELVHRSCAGKHVVFLGRDCQLLHRLYTAYYGWAFYLPFSRQIAVNQPAEGAAYLSSHSLPNSMFVDMSSTGATWQMLREPFDVLIAIYSDTFWYTPRRPTPPPTFKFLTAASQIGPTNLVLELMNCGDHGRLAWIEVHEGRLMHARFAEQEYPPEIVTLLHTPVARACQVASIYRQGLRFELGRLSTDELKKGFGEFAVKMCARQDIYDSMRHYIETTAFQIFDKERSPSDSELSNPP